MAHEKRRTVDHCCSGPGANEPLPSERNSDSIEFQKSVIVPPSPATSRYKGNGLLVVDLGTLELNDLGRGKIRKLGASCGGENREAVGQLFVKNGGNRESISVVHHFVPPIEEKKSWFPEQNAAKENSSPLGGR